MGEFVLPHSVLRVDPDPGAHLAVIAERAGAFLNSHCGHRGTCGGCTMHLVEGQFRLRGEPVRPRRWVLGCQCVPETPDFVVEVPDRSLVEVGEAIDTEYVLPDRTSGLPTTQTLRCEVPAADLDRPRGDLERLIDCLPVRPTEVPLSVIRQLPRSVHARSPSAVTATLGRVPGGWRVVDVEWGHRSEPDLALAVDVGTTTVAVALLDAETGEQIATAAAYNRQLSRGDNVSARIRAAGELGGIDELRRLVVDDTLRSLIRCLGARPDRIRRVAVSGNTVMQLLFCGIDPTPVGTLPFTPAACALPTLRAGDLGLDVHPEAPVDFLPGMGGYVGGDATADLLVSGLLESEDLCLLVDLGTNAEIAVGSSAGFRICAAPAGPAWESGAVGCGMRGARGAVDRITVDPERGGLLARVIGGGAPLGICGSGLVDLLAAGRRAGLLTSRGRFCGSWQGHDRIEVAWEVTVSEREISDLIQAKAAVQAAVALLGGQPGRIVLAGGFSCHLDPESAMAIGLLPELALDRVRVIGNASLGGAVLALRDANVLPRMREIASRAEVVELNRDPGFEDAFTSALTLDPVHGRRTE
jgi:uncharacterized 2Fe-2S/4Fe-4S cluster protein (DUF4445 family)